MFGGEGRASEGPGVRSTDSHEAFLYDSKVRQRSCWFVDVVVYSESTTKHVSSLFQVSQRTMLSGGCRADCTLAILVARGDRVLPTNCFTPPPPGSTPRLKNGHNPT